MKISINKVKIRKSLIHLYTAIGFAVISLVFYSPLLDGKNSPVFIARERVQDIDNELDWDYAEKKGIILASET